MASNYILQESQGRYSITVNSNLVKTKGWEKGEDLDIRLVGNKLKVSEGSDYKLHNSAGRFFITVPVATELGWEKGDELKWSVDGNGDLVLSKP